MATSYHFAMRYVMSLVLVAIVACGPSAAEIKTAKQASYQGSTGEIFDIVAATVAEDYKIGEVQRSGPFVLATVPQWYNPEGGRQSAGAGGFVQLDDRSVQLTMIVQAVESEPGKVMVTVTPKTFQHLSGSPKPRELAPDDPNLPPWIHGRVDSLYVAIHKRLQKYAVQ